MLHFVPECVSLDQSRVALREHFPGAVELLEYSVLCEDLALEIVSASRPDDDAIPRFRVIELQMLSQGGLWLILVFNQQVQPGIKQVEDEQPVSDASST